MTKLGRATAAGGTLRLSFFKGVVWTVGLYGAGQMLRIVSSVILARLLSPEIFGLMVIVYTLRTGIDLFSDVGVGQSIVQKPDAEEPDFYNTAWTVQCLRGLVLWVVCLIASEPAARFYHSPSLFPILAVSSFYFVFFGFSSISIYLLQKRLQVAKLNIFVFCLDLTSVVANIFLAYFNPTVWALVYGALFYAVARMIGTHLLLSDIPQRFTLVKERVRQIFSFGIWITVSSAIYFLSMSFDRLYLGAVASLTVLGIYGIARNMSDVMVTLVIRLCSYVIFPFAAAASDKPRDELRNRLRPMRLKSMLLVALCLSLIAALADIPIKILYDERYHSAAQMLPIMAIGVWFSILVNINEWTLLGFGKPLYGAVANTVKMTWLVVALPLLFLKYGIFGAIVAVSLSDCSKYIPILVGQTRMKFSFAAQDLMLTAIMLALTATWVWARWALGFGTAFGAINL